MAKSAAERKAAQRARQSAAGGRKLELVLDALPVKSCPCAGDSQCWVTHGWHAVKLTM